MPFVEWSNEETLVEHLLRNADELALPRTDRLRLQHALQLIGGSRRERRAAKEIAAEVYRRLLEGVAETVQVELRAGGEAGQWNDAGAVRLSSRDGLATLHASGKITDAHFQAAMIYRRAYEARGAGALRSQLEERPAGGGGSTEGLIIGSFLRAKYTLKAEALERAVIEASRGDPSRRGRREIRALREIAGEGRTLSSLNKGGSMQAVYLAALVRALEACLNVLSKKVQSAA